MMFGFRNELIVQVKCKGGGVSHGYVFEVVAGGWLCTLYRLLLVVR